MVDVLVRRDGDELIKHKMNQVLGYIQHEFAYSFVVHNDYPFDKMIQDVERHYHEVPDNKGTWVLETRERAGSSLAIAALVSDYLDPMDVTDDEEDDDDSGIVMRLLLSAPACWYRYKTTTGWARQLNRFPVPVDLRPFPPIA